MYRACDHTHLDQSLATVEVYYGLHSSCGLAMRQPPPPPRPMIPFGMQGWIRISGPNNNGTWGYIKDYKGFGNGLTTHSRALGYVIITSERGNLQSCNILFSAWSGTGDGLSRPWNLPPGFLWTLYKFGACLLNSGSMAK